MKEGNICQCRSLAQSEAVQRSGEPIPLPFVCYSSPVSFWVFSVSLHRIQKVTTSLCPLSRRHVLVSQAATAAHPPHLQQRANILPRDRYRRHASPVSTLTLYALAPPSSSLNSSPFPFLSFSLLPLSSLLFTCQSPFLLFFRIDNVPQPPPSWR